MGASFSVCDKSTRKRPGIAFKINIWILEKNKCLLRLWDGD